MNKMHDSWLDYKSEWLADEHESEVLVPLAAAYEAGYVDASDRLNAEVLRLRERIQVLSAIRTSS